MLIDQKSIPVLNSTNAVCIISNYIYDYEYFLNELFQMKQLKKSRCLDYAKNFKIMDIALDLFQRSNQIFNLNQNNTSCIQLPRWITTDSMSYFETSRY